jgi:hypothetical protein
VQEVGALGFLVTGTKASAGDQSGASGTKMGHADLTWAYSEAAGLCLRNHPARQPSLTRLETPHGQAQRRRQKYSQALTELLSCTPPLFPHPLQQVARQV